MCGAKKAFFGLFMVLLSLFAAVLFGGSAQAAAGINQQLNFQGKVVNSSGNNIADGTYNMEFKIYQDGTNTGSGSTLKWTEDWLVGGSGGVAVSAGTFNVALGSHNAFASQVDWNQDTLWLSFQVGSTSNCTITTNFQSNCSGDGEMTPFIRLTAVPYAMNANQLGGVAATSYARLDISNTFAANQTISLASGTAASLSVRNTTNGSTANSAVIFGNDAGGLAGYIAQGSSTYSALGGASSLNLINQLSANLTLGTGGASRLWIDSAGRVNIGSAAPGSSGSLLQIAGAIQPKQTNASAWASGLEGSFVYDDTANKFYLYDNTNNLKEVCNKVDLGCGAGGATTLQSAYTAGNTITTPTTGSASDLTVNLSNSSGTDSSLLVNIATGSTGKFAVQDNGTDLLSVIPASVDIGTDLNVYGATGITLLTGSSSIYLNGGSVVLAGSVSDGITLNPYGAQITIGAINLTARASATSLGIDGAIQPVQTNASFWAAGLEGSFVYDDTANKFYGYNNSAKKEFGTLQGDYDWGNSLTTTSARDLSINLADTAVDSNFVVNTAASSTSLVQFQYNSTNVLQVDPLNNRVAVGSNGVAQTAILSVAGSSGNAFSVMDGSNGALFNADTTSGFVINNGVTSLNNDVSNPSFEGTVGTPYSGWNGSGVTTSTTDSRTGQRHYEMTSASDVNSIKYYEVTPGDAVYFEGWMKASAGATGSAGFFIQWFDYNKSSVGFSNAFDTAYSTTYAAKSISTTVPSNAAYARISMTYRAGATGTFYFDDIFLGTRSWLGPLQLRNSAGLDVFNVNTSPTANLVSNPSIENNTNGWAAKNTATIAYNNTAGNALFGNASLKITNTAANDGAKYNLALKPSTTYTASFWAKVSTGTATVTFGRQENGSDGAVTCNSVKNGTATVTTEWLQFSCNSFTTGSTVNNATNIYVTLTGTTTVTYIDGVSFVPTDTALSYNSATGNYSNVSINASNSGELQPWQQSANSLTAVREASATVTSNGYIYNIGGYDGSARSNAVMYANMNSDGSTGAWATTTAITNNAVAQNRQYPTAAVANGYVYVIGGFDGTQANSSVFYSKLNSDGTTGTWYCQGAVTAPGCGATGQPVNGNGLPAARVAAASIVSNGYIYVIGGCSDSAATCGTPTNTIYFAKLQADGSTGPWTTSARTLSTARGMLTANFVNGWIVIAGGRVSGGPGSTTVEKAQIGSTGELNANFSTTGMTALPANRQEHTAAIANGYLYIIGGSDGAASPARQSTVYYSKINSDGTNNVWVSAGNSLPLARSAQATIVANGYIYALGGCGLASAGACTTNQTNTVYYASTPRTLVGGTLDLIGLSGQSLTDFGGGGALTAGNGRFIGELKVDGYADFNNGISVDSGLNVNAVSSTAGQTVFNINNLNSNSIFSVRHMGTNFGSLATGGAFIGRNSYWGEEFNTGHTTACNTTAALSTGTVNAFARGDSGGNANTTTACASGATTTVNGGELNVADVIGTATIANNQCLISSQNAANGVERISAVIATATALAKAACVENLAFNTTTSNKIFTTINLPVITAKVKMQAFSANGSGSFFVVGANIRDHPGTDTTGTALPNTGVFFTNCSGYTNVTGVPTGCSNTNWYGMVSSGGSIVGSIQTCTGPGSLSGHFAYLRIEVRATNDIHFFSDYDTSDGITEIECGSGVTAASSTSAMTPWIQVNANANAVLTNTLDVDYIRSWQDDNVPPQDANTNDGPDTTDTSVMSAAPLTTDSVAESDDPSSLFRFSAATSEDTVFNKDVYVKGTLYASKIKANQIEGLEVFTDKISSLQDQLAQEKANTASDQTTTPSPTPGLDTTSPVNFSDLNAVNLVALAQIESRGGLVVDKDAQFNGKTIFQLLADFKGDVNFDKQPSFNSDAGGTAVIKKDAQKVQVKFANEYAQKPIVIASWSTDSDNSDDQAKLFTSGYNFLVTKIDQKGFWIYLNKPADQDLTLNWMATSVKDAKISTSEPVPSSTAQ